MAFSTSTAAVDHAHWFDGLMVCHVVSQLERHAPAWARTRLHVSADRRFTYFQLSWVNDPHSPCNALTPEEKAVLIAHMKREIAPWAENT